jgi:hypothetical protein
MPESTETPPVNLKMDERRAKRFAWAAYTLGGVGLVATSLVGAGFLPSKTWVQVVGWVATVTNGLAIYLARGIPTSSQYREKPGEDNA